MVPVKLPDKNGVMVTRWVKPRESGSAALGTLPAPKPPTVQRQALYEHVLIDPNDLANICLDTEEIRAKLRRLPEDTAGALNGMIERNYNLSVISGIIATALHRNDPPATLENLALLYNDYQYEDTEWTWKEHVGYAWLSADLRGLFTYPQFEGIRNINREDDATKNRAQTLVQVMYEAEKDPDTMVSTMTHEGKTRYLKDPDFVQLLWDNSDTPEKAGTVLDLVYQWGCDAAAVRQALATTVPLRDGVL